VIADNLSDAIIGICHKLNQRDDDRLWSPTLAGSRLALDLLEDGAARQSPKDLKALADTALRLLLISNGPHLTQLAAVFHPRLEQLYRDHLVRVLHEQIWQQTLGAWGVLVRLIDAGHEWAIDLGNSSWPVGNMKHQRAILYNIPKDTRSEWILSRLFAVIPSEASLSPLHRMMLHISCDEDDSVFPAWWFDVKRLVPGYGHRASDEIEVRFVEDGNPLTFGVEKVCEDPRLGALTFSGMPAPVGVLAVLVGAARFAADPSAARLAEELRILVGCWDPANHWVPRYPPMQWPFAACVYACQSLADLERITTRAEAGEFGDQEDWQAAQERWSLQGVSEADILTFNENTWPFDERIREVGFPIVLPVSVTNPDVARVGFGLKYVEKVRLNTSEVSTRSILADWILDLYESCKQDVFAENAGAVLAFPDLTLLREIVSDREGGWFDWNILFNWPWVLPLSSECIGFLDWLGTTKRLYRFGNADVPRELCQAIATAFNEDPKRRGLLRMLADFSEAQCELAISSDHLRSDRFEEPRDRLAAIRIRVTQSDFAESECESLASDVIACQEKITRSSRMVLSDLESRELGGPALESFVLSLQRVLRPDDTAAQRSAHRILRGWADARRSGFHEAENRKHLGLKF